MSLKIWHFKCRLFDCLDRGQWCLEILKTMCLCLRTFNIFSKNHHFVQTQVRSICIFQCFLFFFLPLFGFLYIWIFMTIKLKSMYFLMLKIPHFGPNCVFSCPWAGGSWINVCLSSINWSCYKSFGGTLCGPQKFMFWGCYKVSLRGLCPLVILSLRGLHVLIIGIKWILIYMVLNSRETLCWHVLFVSSSLEFLGLFRLRQCFLVCLDEEILLHNKAPCLSGVCVFLTHVSMFSFLRRLMLPNVFGEMFCRFKSHITVAM